MLKCRLLLLVLSVVAPYSGFASFEKENQTGQASATATAKKPPEIAFLYGGIHQFAYYFVDILVGTPPQRQSVIVDSGSSLLGFPCRSCKQCGKHIDAPFDFEKSTTARWLDCKSKQCTTSCGFSNRCTYKQRYSEGSAIAGYYFSDVVSLGDAERQNAFVTFDHIGCHQEENNLFTTQDASGIMGIGFPRYLSGSTIVDALFGAPNVDTKMFALCLSEFGGQMYVGGFQIDDIVPCQGTATKSRRLLGQSTVNDFGFYNGRNLAGPVMDKINETKTLASHIGWTKIVDDDAYRVAISTITFNGKQMSNQHYDALVDSGTTFAYFPRAIYSLILKELTDLCRADKRCNTATRCWTVGDAEEHFKNIASFIITMRDQTSVEWRARSWLHWTGPDKWCPALEANNNDSIILGASFLKNQLVIFHREQDSIGFACAECPRHLTADRPLPPVSVAGDAMLAERNTSNDSVDSSNLWFQNPYSLHFVSSRTLWISGGAFMGLLLGVIAVIPWQTLRRRPPDYAFMTEGETVELHDVTLISEFSDESSYYKEDFVSDEDDKHSVAAEVYVQHA